MMFALLLALGADPEAAAVDPDCGGNTVEMVQCANRSFDRADRELNSLWRDIADDLGRQDRQFDDHLEPRLDIAQKAQNAWLAFRDAQCAAYADLEGRGGTIYPLIYIGCRTDMTRERIEHLRPLVGK
ncbi:lysozyme inhibitor LprI family protein [Sphingopyxis sp.]|uniref:lysozyme inhibitor LprI family protein n=1 Tax=Sphingopyxis sp. TaxID=1908224 RepID=UPI003D14D464